MLLGLFCTRVEERVVQWEVPHSTSGGLNPPLHRTALRWFFFGNWRKWQGMPGNQASHLAKMVRWKMLKVLGRASPKPRTRDIAFNGVALWSVCGLWEFVNIVYMSVSINVLCWCLNRSVQRWERSQFARAQLLVERRSSGRVWILRVSVCNGTLVADCWLGLLFSIFIDSRPSLYSV